MTDEEVRQVILSGAGVQHHITMEERAKLHILPGPLQTMFKCAMLDYAEGKMWEALNNRNSEDFEKWQRIYYQRGAT